MAAARTCFTPPQGARGAAHVADLPPHARTAAGEKELRAEPVRSAACPTAAGGRAGRGWKNRRGRRDGRWVSLFIIHRVTPAVRRLEMQSEQNQQRLCLALGTVTWPRPQMGTPCQGLGKVTVVSPCAAPHDAPLRAPSTRRGHDDSAWPSGPSHGVTAAAVTRRRCHVDTPGTSDCDVYEDELSRDLVASSCSIIVT